MVAGTGDGVHWEPRGDEVVTVANDLALRCKGHIRRIKRESKILGFIAVVGSGRLANILIRHDFDGWTSRCDRHQPISIYFIPSAIAI